MIYENIEAIYDKDSNGLLITEVSTGELIYKNIDCCKIVKNSLVWEDADLFSINVRKSVRRELCNYSV